MVDPPQSFGDVQGVTVRMAGAIEPGLIVKADHIDDQGVALPLAYGVAHPEWRIQKLVMWTPVYINVAHDSVVLVHHDQFIRQLHNFYRLGMKVDTRQAGWKTSVDRIV